MYTHPEEENAATINYLKNLQKGVLVHNTRSKSIINRVYSLFYFFTFCKYLDIHYQHWTISLFIQVKKNRKMYMIYKLAGYTSSILNHLHYLTALV
jgi:hypothetical protein